MNMLKKLLLIITVGATVPASSMQKQHVLTKDNLISTLCACIDKVAAAEPSTTQHAATVKTLVQ